MIKRRGMRNIDIAKDKIFNGTKIELLLTMPIELLS
jgi:hypothetical protein